MNAKFLGIAIKNLVGGHYQMNADYSIKYLSDQTPPSKAEIDAEIKKVEQEYIALQYQRDRIYPSLAEQADLQYWDLINDTTTWKDVITKVKSDNPKP